MRKTLTAVFYNEEYLLPWWLEHHKRIFDHGILINYASTDRSVDIIKDICPKWEVIDSRNGAVFDAKKVDEEVQDIEENIDGWKLCLNLTEFLVGDYSLFNNWRDKRITMPCTVMVDNDPSNLPTYDKSLIEQKHHGIYYSQGGSKLRRGRTAHCNRFENYPLGRHYDDWTTDKLQILWYGWSPFNDYTIKRKLQIQTRIPESDKARGYGGEHITTHDKLTSDWQNKFIPQSRDLSVELLKYV